jgi:hypothetical protein
LTAEADTIAEVVSVMRRGGAGLPFADGFESGDWSRWSGSVP